MTYWTAFEAYDPADHATDAFEEGAVDYEDCPAGMSLDDLDYEDRLAALAEEYDDCDDDEARVLAAESLDAARYPEAAVRG
jgi:hypothetical protein